MRKFSKLNESKSIDENNVNSKLVGLEELGLSYKTYDYYYNGDRLISDIKGIKDGDRKALLIVISGDLNTSRLDVDGWNDILKFNMSYFAFTENFETFKSCFLKVFSIIDSLKEYKPRLCFKDEEFLILLEGQVVSSDELDVNNDIKKSYYKLYKLLKEYTDQEKDSGIKDITFWEQQNNIYVKFSKTSWWAEYEKGSAWCKLASLCTQMKSQNGYTWMETVLDKLDPKLVEIRDTIKEDGFTIQYVNHDDSDRQVKLTLSEI